MSKNSKNMEEKRRHPSALKVFEHDLQAVALWKLSNVIRSIQTPYGVVRRELDLMGETLDKMAIYVDGTPDLSRYTFVAERVGTKFTEADKALLLKLVKERK